MGQLVQVRKTAAALGAELGFDALRRSGLSNKAAAGLTVGGTAALVGGQEVVGRKIGSRRYKAGKHVNDGFFMGPGVNRGYFAAERKEKGAMYGAARRGPSDGAKVQGVRKAATFATRDQNSSIGTTYSLKKPQGDGIKPTLTAQTRTGAFAGKTRGVGRHLGRDQNSSPGSAVVRTPTLRDIQGKFAGQGQGVKVFHPIGGNNRQKGAVHTKQVFRGVKKPELLKKNDDRKGMLGPVNLAAMAPHTGARVGRRL